MGFEKFIKLASSDPVAARGLATLMKIAQQDSNETTKFNESVPAAQVDPMTGQPANQEQGWQPQSNQTTTNKDQEAQLLPPDQAAALQGQGTDAIPNPMNASAEAARTFVGPDIFNAAMQGDQNAVNLIAQVASTIVSGQTGAVQPATMEGQDPASAQGGEAQPPNSFAEAGIPATPEEQIANLIIQPVQAAAPQPPRDAPGDPQNEGDQPPTDDKKGGFPPKKDKTPDVTVKVGGQEKTSSDKMATLKLMAGVIKTADEKKKSENLNGAGMLTTMGAGALGGVGYGMSKFKKFNAVTEGFKQQMMSKVPENKMADLLTRIAKGQRAGRQRLVVGGALRGAVVGTGLGLGAMAAGVLAGKAKEQKAKLTSLIPLVGPYRTGQANSKG